MKIDKPHNFDNAFAGTTGSAYGVVTALYNVIWSYIGYSNANYALSETKNPVRTLKIAAPTALISVAVIYMFVNVSLSIILLVPALTPTQIAYFAAVPKDEILSSGRILAASYFRNVFGNKAERALSVFVALSAFGNVLSVIFSQGRRRHHDGHHYTAMLTGPSRPRTWPRGYLTILSILGKQQAIQCSASRFVRALASLRHHHAGASARRCVQFHSQVCTSHPCG